MGLNNEQRELLGRGTQEVVPGLEQAAEELDPDGTAYVGYEPSGRLHLGHMLTAQKLKDLEDIGMDTTVLLADEHAFINDKPAGVADEEARHRIDQIADMYETAFDAFGLEADIIRGRGKDHDGFQVADPDYQILLGGVLRETPQSDNEGAIADIASGDSRSAGQTIYPSMQVADMYHLDVDVAVGGIDQRAIHMMARDNVPLGFEADDKPFAVHTPIIGINVGEGEKMSSSGSSIPVYAERDEIQDEINRMYLPPSVDQVRSDFDFLQPDQRDDFELIYDSSPVLQLINHYTFERGEEFDITRPDKYGGDVSYDSSRELIESIGFDDDEVHPADVKGGLADMIYESFEAPRNAILDEGLHEPVEDLYND